MHRSNIHLAPLLLVVLSTLQPAARAQTTVAHYDFDQATGSTAVDLSGNGNNGNFVGAIPAAGIPTGCTATTGVDFPIDTGRIEVPDAPSLRPAHGVTVEAWVLAAPLSEVRVVVGKQVNLGADSYVLFLNSDGSVGFSVNDGSVAGFVGGPAVADSEWHHLAGVLRDGQLQIYVDGSLGSSAPFAGPIAYDANPVTLGNDLNGTSWFEALFGQLDDVRIRDYGLSSDEVVATYLASGTAAAIPRNGSGVNPSDFASLTDPKLGAPWQASVALDNPGTDTSVVALSLAPSVPLPTLFGELLCLPPFAALDFAAGSHSLLVADNCALVGAGVCAQAARISGTEVTFLNALDLQFGSF
ncbi:MAG: LamG domain-containing protein [Planctomycetota bacterium]